MSKIIKIGKVTLGGQNPFVLIAGPCVIENRRTVFHIADALQAVTRKLKIPLIFKASYDKANRTSLKSFRGIGRENGLRILHEVKEKFGLPVTSDVHTPDEIDMAADYLDLLQIPAFLCRQTDLLIKAGASGKPVNVKKGQFLAPWDISAVVAKIESTGNRNILLTERGVSFGYNTLVSDFRSLAIMRRTGYPVVFDASHSVQQPGGLRHASGGQSEFIPLLARCGVAAGCDAVFIEVHSRPQRALSDGPNMLPVKFLLPLLQDLKKIDAVVKKRIQFYP